VWLARLLFVCCGRPVRARLLVALAGLAHVGFALWGGFGLFVFLCAFGLWSGGRVSFGLALGLRLRCGCGWWCFFGGGGGVVGLLLCALVCLFCFVRCLGLGVWRCFFFGVIWLCVFCRFLVCLPGVGVSVFWLFLFFLCLFGVFWCFWVGGGFVLGLLRALLVCVVWLVGLVSFGLGGAVGCVGVVVFDDCWGVAVVSLWGCFGFGVLPFRCCTGYQPRIRSAGDIPFQLGPVATAGPGPCWWPASAWLPGWASSDCISERYHRRPAGRAACGIGGRLFLPCWLGGYSPVGARRKHGPIRPVPELWLECQSQLQQGAATAGINHKGISKGTRGPISAAIL